MAAVVEPEIQFAQKLASNEKSVRKKALRKLRNYINARSKTTSGFSEEELLKLWKGLFYCLWMQDKPLLQEELSTQISDLVHHFDSFSAQLLFFETFLTTVKREWTGIDRLRMDKFFQLVRFIFRQMFVLLQKSQWDSSGVAQFLKLLSSSVLQAEVPSVGIQLHVLDLYLRELAVVGAHQLTAQQNLLFIEPFMKMAAKTKDSLLFGSISSSIFGTIIDQAPFAIQELLKELEQDSDSGQASDDQDEPDRALKSSKAKAKGSKAKVAKANKATAPMNGSNTHSDEEEDDEDDGLSDSERPVDEDVGPVLQFDYGAVAEKLLHFSSREKTPNHNRQRLYKIIKIFQDLSEGTFPQDEYPEEVSTDEDDEDFGSRKRIKRKLTLEENLEAEPEQKKVKGKKTPSLEPSAESVSAASQQEVKKKRKRKKKKSRTEPADSSSHTAHVDAEASSEPQVQPEDQPEPEAAQTSQENPSSTTTTPQLTKKKRKKAKKAQSLNNEQQNGPTADEQTSENNTTASPEKQETTKSEEKINNSTHNQELTTPEDSTRDSAQNQESTQSCKKKKKKKETNSCLVKQQEEPVTEEALVAVETAAEQTQLDSESLTPEKSVKPAKRLKRALQPDADGGCSSEKKLRKKKRIIPVEFEYEADEGQPESKTPLSSRPQKLQTQQRAQQDFVTFSSSSAPTPLFCRALNTCTKTTTPKSDSKKVRFGLKNNKTAEFRRTDRSLLLSPEGSSRVPFDPDQKPKCGVLKSPPTPAPKRKKKKKSGVPSRPTAADFF